MQNKILSIYHTNWYFKLILNLISYLDQPYIDFNGVK